MPIHVLKFRTINKYLIDSLVRGYLYFPSPFNLNDPFDCNVDIDRALYILKTKQHDEDLKLQLQTLYEHFKKQPEDEDTILNNLSQHAKKWGICSFCAFSDATLYSPLMWSHYAAEHRGICLQYQIPESLVEKNGIMGFSNVDFDLLNLEKIFLEMAKSLKETNSIDPEYAIKLAECFLILKHPAWKYEDEIRLVRNEIGPVFIPPEFLQTVYFGLRTADSDKLLIEKIIKNNGYEGIKLMNIILNPQENFGLLKFPFQPLPKATQ